MEMIRVVLRPRLRQLNLLTLLSFLLAYILAKVNKRKSDTNNSFAGGEEAREDEGWDRFNITLPPIQEQLVQVFSFG
jgi:hypothetical protein